VIDQATVVRAAALYLPVTAAVILWSYRRVPRRAAAGLLLAFCWNLWTLMAIHFLALRFHWWSFSATGGLFWGFPVDLWLGWTLLWGVLPYLALPRWPLPLQIAVFLVVDLVLMPLCRPVVLLGEHWLIGEAVALAFCLLPSQLLLRWTLEDTHLGRRVFLQLLTFAGVCGFLVIAFVAERDGITFAMAVAPSWLRSPGWLRGLVWQLLLIPTLLGVSAVLEFAERGRGTPIPYDPPSRLVTSGPYAYTANPMQLAAVLSFALLGIVCLNGKFLAAAVVAFVYSAGLAAWDEDQDLRARFGKRWLRYRARVRPWRMRWRPWHPTTRGVSGHARLYVAESCGVCSQIGRWFLAHEIVGLHVLAAEDHPTRDLNRITYDPADGSAEVQGVIALARGLEHIHLGWALAGWTLRLPPIAYFAQLLVDATGWGPMRVQRRSNSGCALPLAESREIPIGEWTVQPYFRGEFW
jgi:protein-S-isoprenylcysteine O-methyltransferase Ste14